ncbi:hypothetical protein [Actinotalea solisilvae]|uniref:hypothetical protein n=1 Tax=Actinotalea solisilvae TaxID=2072922 RepID=UPI0018F2169C|nr:hypothetical protein [Actinotalea solisilvae]
MTYPSPEDMKLAPAWDNYVVAQLSQAALGIIPVNALALGAEIFGSRVRLHFQLTTESEQDIEDMREIEDGLSDLVGDAVQIERAVEIRAEPSLAPRGVRWVYRVRQDG